MDLTFGSFEQEDVTCLLDRLTVVVSFSVYEQGVLLSGGFRSCHSQMLALR